MSLYAWFKTPTVHLIWAECICQILTQNQLFCFCSHKEDKHPQQSETVGSKASSLCVFTSICFGMPLFPLSQSSWKQCGMFHKLTIKHSWFCFVIISIWCQADCNAEATTFIQPDYMVVGDHTFCVWSGMFIFLLFFVFELAEGFIKILQRDTHFLGGQNSWM